MAKEAKLCPKCKGTGNDFIYLCWECKGTGYIKISEVQTQGRNEEKTELGYDF